MSKPKNDGKRSIFTDVEKLVHLLEESDLAVIEVAGNGRKIRLTKIGGGINQTTNKKNGERNALAPVTKNYLPDQSQTNTVEIKSTMVGTIYLTPENEEMPYINLGVNIKKGQTIFRTVAVGLSNEIKSELDGQVSKILVEPGQVVEYDQTLIEIKTIA